jgi:hypothetical protein
VPLQRPLTAQRQELLHEVLRTAPSAEDALQVTPDAALRRHISQREFGIAQNGTQECGEVMGNLASHKAQLL